MKPVSLDGWIYVVIAVAGALRISLGSDEAAKYVTAVELFWIKLIVDSVGAGFLALKMYRSTAFADYKTAMNGKYQQQNEPKPKTGNTEILNKNEIPTIK